MARGRVKDNVGHILYYIFDIVFDGIFGRPYVAGGVTRKPPLQGPELGIMSHDPFHRRYPLATVTVQVPWLHVFLQFLVIDGIRNPKVVVKAHRGEVMMVVMPMTWHHFEQHFLRYDTATRIPGKSSWSSSSLANSPCPSLVSVWTRKGGFLHTAGYSRRFPSPGIPFL